MAADGGSIKCGEKRVWKMLVDRRPGKTGEKLLRCMRETTWKNKVWAETDVKDNFRQVREEGVPGRCNY